MHASALLPRSNNLACSHACIGLGAVAKTMCRVVSFTFNIHFVPGFGRYRLLISPHRLYLVVQHERDRDAPNHLLPGVFPDHFVSRYEVAVNDHSTRLFTGSCQLRLVVIRRYLLLTLKSIYSSVYPSLFRLINLFLPGVVYSAIRLSLTPMYLVTQPGCCLLAVVHRYLSSTQ